MNSIACTLLQVYVIALFARIILSYFPLQEGGLFAGLYSLLYSVTEPVLGPLRRILPALGPFDLSPIVVFFVIQFVLSPLVCR